MLAERFLTPPHPAIIAPLSVIDFRQMSFLFILQLNNVLWNNTIIVIG